MRKKYFTEEERRAAHRESEARRRVRNPEAVKISNQKADAKRWTEKPEVMREQHRINSITFRTKHPEQVAAWASAWSAANPEKVRFYSHLRRADIACAKGTCTQEQIQARVNFYGGCCYVCILLGKQTPYEAIDHVIPLSKGGSNWPSNLRPICKKHNSQKHTKTLATFLKKVLDV